tara:strand:+ start:33426 stop:33992 length:567 start_codon:yes stop_codon:yes gene_type:complete
MSDYTDSLQDHFLIAMPSLDGSYFERSVAYVCDHSSEGAMGLVINHPLDVMMGEVFEDLKIDVENPYAYKQTVVSGGPVQPGAGFVLHPSDRMWKHTFQVSDAISVTTSADILKDMAKQQARPNAFITLGFSGWGPQQLEKEITENSWLTCPADPEIIFNTPVKDRWKAALGLMGIEPVQLSSFVGHA